MGLHQRKSCHRKPNPSSLSDFDNWFRRLQGSLYTGQQPLYTSLHSNVKNIDVDSYKLTLWCNSILQANSLMQFNQMAILSYELRMLEQSKQHPPIICGFFFVCLFVCFCFFYIYLLLFIIIIIINLFLYFYFIFGTSFIVCGWIPGLLCLTKAKFSLALSLSLYLPPFRFHSIMPNEHELCLSFLYIFMYRYSVASVS